MKIRNFTNYMRMLLIAAFFVFIGHNGWGQQIIGSYPSMDGGLENQSGTLATASTINSAQTYWTTQIASSGVITSTGGRSGPKYVTYTQTGMTHRRLQTPTDNVTAASHVVQFYYQGDLDGTIAGDNIRGAASAVGTSSPAYGAYINSCNTGAVWTKYTAVITTTGTPAYGIGIVSVNNTAQFKIDDFVIYAGSAVDVTAANSPGAVTVNNPTTTSLDVSWGAASGGVDGGGYVVVRYAVNPDATDDPNQNGIYAVGNTFSVVNTGTVRYIGTGTSFTDNVGLSAGSTYYYKVYTVDKAFNYSGESSGSGTTSAAALTPPTLTADVTSNNVDNNIDITFTDDASWRAAITAVKIGVTSLTVTTDYVITAGNLQLKPSGLNALLTTSGSKSVVVTATGYDNATVSQEINPGADAKLGMKTQPTAPATNGGTLAVQPAVYIQDQYGNTTTSTANVDAAVGAGSWTLGGGTTSVAGISGTVTYSGLTATSTAYVTGATIAFTSSVLTGVTSAAFDIPCPEASLPFYENFNYSSSTLLTNNCWTAHSGAGTNPITVFSANPITYSNYPSSGVGNYVTLVASGEDVNRIFAPQTSGVIYAAFLVNVTSAPTVDDYFFHLGPTTIGTTFKGRVFVKNDGSNNLSFGVSQSSTTTITYSTPSYALNTTYLIVLKYSIVSGSANDVASIIINPAIGTTEPSTGWLTNADSPTDPANIGSVALRQGTNSPALTIDGIRVAKTWGEVIGTAWEGTTSTDWNIGTNWSDGIVPTSSENVYINPQTNQPQVTAASNCNNLTITPGAGLTINTSQSLTIAGNMLIQSDATGTGSFIDNGTLNVSGTTTVQKYLTDSRWWYIGAPLSNATAAAFTTLAGAPTTSGNRLFYWDESTHAYVNVTNTADAMPVFRGYSFKRFTESAPDPITVAFSGALNTAQVTPIGGTSNLTYNSVSYQGFNLICNPFPSAINWGCGDTPTPGLTQTNLENTIWYRTNGGFATYNWSGAGTGQNTGERIIPAMQAFWVRVLASPGTGGVQVTNATRLHSSTTFYKTAAETNIFRMTVTDGITNDEAVVGFYANALSTYEDYDSEKMFYTDEDVPQLYSLTSDYSEVAINGQAELSAGQERIVPLGFSTNVAGTFTINATNLTEFDPSVSVYLEDVQLNVIQDLNQNASYTFTSGIVNTASRFKLHFGNFITDISSESKNNVFLYAAENNIYVSTSEEATIEVYSSLGEKISSEHAVKGLNKIPLNAATSIYIVKVQTGNDVITEKVFIGK